MPSIHSPPAGVKCFCFQRCSIEKETFPTESFISDLVMTGALSRHEQSQLCPDWCGLLTRSLRLRRDVKPQT